MPVRWLHAFAENAFGHAFKRVSRLQYMRLAFEGKRVSRVFAASVTRMLCVRKSARKHLRRLKQSPEPIVRCQYAGCMQQLRQVNLPLQLPD